MADLTTLPQLLEHMAAGSADGPARTLFIREHPELVRLLIRKYPQAFAAWRPSSWAFLKAMTVNLAGVALADETAAWIGRQGATVVGLQGLSAEKNEILKDRLAGTYVLEANESVGYLYDASATGEGLVVEASDPSWLRAFRSIFPIWFPRIGLLCVVVYASKERADLRERVEKLAAKMLRGTGVSPRRILFMGDFKDASGAIQELSVLGMTLRVPSQLPTCCYPDFSRPGDYILDTNTQNPVLYTKIEMPALRHHPVVLEDIDLYKNL